MSEVKNQMEIDLWNHHCVICVYTKFPADNFESLSAFSPFKKVHALFFRNPETNNSGAAEFSS